MVKEFHFLGKALSSSFLGWYQTHAVLEQALTTCYLENGTMTLIHLCERDVGNIHREECGTGDSAVMPDWVSFQCIMCNKKGEGGGLEGNGHYSTSILKHEMKA